MIGGGVAKAGEYVFGPIRRVIEERTMKIFHEGLTIVPAKLGNDAGMIGSAALALDQRRRARKRPFHLWLFIALRRIGF